jgi:hypothetical protein
LAVGEAEPPDNRLPQLIERKDFRFTYTFPQNIHAASVIEQAFKTPTGQLRQVKHGRTVLRNAPHLFPHILVDTPVLCV